jgi:hypothetical protein
LNVKTMVRFPGLNSGPAQMVPPQRIRDKGQQHLPNEEAWLVGEQRPSGERKYYLASLAR